MITAVAVVLDSVTAGSGFAGTASLTGGFSGITEFTGGRGMDDSLTGLDSASSTWTLGMGDDSYVSTETLGFRNVENLVGGTGMDTFNVNAHSGDLTGGGGADVFTVTGALMGSITWGGRR